MNRIRQWFYKQKLRREKEYYLFQGYKDIEFFEKFKSREINANIDALRKRFSEERQKKDEGKPHDDDLIGQLAKDIAEAQAHQGEYKKTKEIIQDFKNYLSCLD